MTEFNWDRMPVELRSKLLELAGMDASFEKVAWVGLSDDEKKSVNTAMVEKTSGSASMKDCPR